MNNIAKKWLSVHALQIQKPLTSADTLSIDPHNMLALDSAPEGRLRMSDVTPLSGISGLSFDFPIPISSLAFLLSPLALSVLSVFC